VNFFRTSGFRIDDSKKTKFPSGAYQRIQFICSGRSQFCRGSDPSNRYWLLNTRICFHGLDLLYEDVSLYELALSFRMCIDFQKASRPESRRGFVPVAKRWVVERSISWTNYFRRIVKDYENTVTSSVHWLYLANHDSANTWILPNIIPQHILKDENRVNHGNSTARKQIVCAMPKSETNTVYQIQLTNSQTFTSIFY
jgi:hypothetical protein